MSNLINLLAAYLILVYLFLNYKFYLKNYLGKDLQLLCMGIQNIFI